MPMPLAHLSLASLSLALLASTAAGRQRRLSDEQLAPVGSAFADYFQARDAGRGLDSARAQLAARIDGLRASLAGSDPLASGADLRRALWLARELQEKGLQPGKIQEDRFQQGSFLVAGLEYAFRLPKSYQTGGVGYALILTLPDEGQRPAAHLRADWTLRAILEEAILLAPAMPAEREEWTQVAVNGRPGGLSHVLTALRLATERFDVDLDRVYVAGSGKGVAAAVAAGNSGPQRFAGVIGRAGDTGTIGPENFSNLPTLFQNGGARATAFQAESKAAGQDNCTLQSGGKQQEVWDWIKAHPRVPNPTSVTVLVGELFPTHAYWLRLAPNAVYSRASATLDRKANELHITSTGVSQVSLLLNDELIDLDRPLRVITGGVEQSVSVPRDLTTMLDLLHEGRSDPARLYVSELSIDMRSAAEGRPPIAVSAADEEYERRLAPVGDAAGLWELYLWCQESGRAQRGELVLQRLLRLDPEHAAAREALGHVRHGEHWFHSAPALERYLASQDPARAAARGRVEFQSLWMHPDERARLSKGLLQQPESGLWLSAKERRKLAKGWVLQDANWIEPAEAPRLDEGLWKVGGEWLALSSANRRHAQLDALWVLPDFEIELHSAADREVALRAREPMLAALDDLRRVFGAEPVLPLGVVLLRDEEQYDSFAFGDPDGRRPATHAGRTHVIHSAFFAESWFQRVEGERVFRGMGVGYWDPLVPSGELYGVHSVRLATGLSYVEALDPSPKAVRRALREGTGPDYYADYQAEKQLPAWLRWGGAVYAERYFRDARALPDGDVWWARQWSLDNLKQRGGARELAQIFAFPLDPEQRDDGLKLLIEAGLLVAFLVDGGLPEVTAAHEDFKRAMLSGRLHSNQIEALEAALRAHEAELRAFAQA